MKKILTIFLIFIISIIKVNALELNISSNTAILYNIDSGEVLYEKNADKKVSVASLTKIMTALVALDNIQNIDQQVTITKEDLKGLIEANAVTAGFKIGDTPTYKDLLYALLLPSGADAAKALARNTLGSEEEFIKKMNEKVKNLNLKNTNFSTVIGLDDINNYSTAREMATIFKEALKNKTFKKIIETDKYETSNHKLTFKSTVKSNAKKFDIKVPYILGGKTGTTTDAGLCLATTAKADNINYMLITTGALYDKKYPHHIMDAKTIYDYFINNYSNQKVVSKKTPFKIIKTKYAKEKNIKLYPNKNIIMYLENNYNKKDVKYIYEGKEIITPFDKQNSYIGKLKIYYQDKLLDTQKITLNKTLTFSPLNFIKEEIIPISISLILIVLIMIIKHKKRAK